MLTTGNDTSYPDVYNPSFIKLENVSGKTRLTVAVTRTDLIQTGGGFNPNYGGSNWVGTFLLNVLLARRTH